MCWKGKVKDQDDETLEVYADGLNKDGDKLEYFEEDGEEWVFGCSGECCSQEE